PSIRPMLALPELPRLPERRESPKQAEKADISAPPAEVKVKPPPRPPKTLTLPESPPVKRVKAVPEFITPPPEDAQPDFGSILSGIQRNDGFDMSESPRIARKPIKVDTPEPLASHKTKRVMDAVLGKNNAVNPLIKANEEAK
ncbi:MAG: hypothetical protein FWD35_06610, partial [Oscillospiraceae bacterium]|nr:hypothetical protein [Oscillospiraceae bacterium]